MEKYLSDGLRGHVHDDDDLDNFVTMDFLTSTTSSRPTMSSTDIDQEILEYTEEISSSLKVCN